LPNEDRGWLGREPTEDEQEIVAWIKARNLPDKVLHVGVGNALLFQEFGRRVSQGLSRDGGEVSHARDLGLDVIFCNKYDVQSYAAKLKNSFDCIVDPNVRSYSCCTAHFTAYMDLMLAALTPGGVLLTSKRGLAYLVPTSLDELRTLCPDWAVSAKGNVVVMRPGLQFRLRSWLRNRTQRKRDRTAQSLDRTFTTPGRRRIVTGRPDIGPHFLHPRRGLEPLLRGIPSRTILGSR
jgi:hypothetical protein